MEPPAVAGHSIDTIEKRIAHVTATMEAFMGLRTAGGGGGQPVQLVQAVDKMLELLKANGLAYIQRISPEFVGVHPTNRYGQGVTPSAVHALLEDICHLGWSWKKVAQATCVEMPVGKFQREHEFFNIELALRSDKQLAPVGAGTLKFYSLSCGHTNQGLRAAHAGVPSTSETLGDNGFMDKGKIASRDPAMGRAIAEGLEWLVLCRQVEVAFPQLLTMIQEALNASDQIHRAESELEVAMKIHQLAKRQFESKGEIDWASVNKA
jgi:hypothetical protein